MRKNIFLLVSLIVILTASTASAFVTNDNSASTSDVSYNDGNCISGVFVAKEDDYYCTITLRSNCTFKIVERDGSDVNETNGTYSIDDNIERGMITTIHMNANDGDSGDALLTWGLEQGMRIVVNGFEFEKQ